MATSRGGCYIYFFVIKQFAFCSVVLPLVFCRDLDPAVTNWGLVVRWDPTVRHPKRGSVLYGDSVESCAVSNWANAKHLGRSSFRIRVFDWIDGFVGPEGGEYINRDANVNFSPCRLQRVFVATSAKTTSCSFGTGATHLAALGYLHFIYRVTRVLRRRVYNSEQLYFAKTVCQCNTQTFVWR